LSSAPCLTGCGHVGSILFGGVQTFF
jgi:hypothetical protein